MSRRVESDVKLVPTREQVQYVADMLMDYDIGLPGAEAVERAENILHELLNHPSASEPVDNR